MFKPGQKVVCVDDKQRHYGRPVGDLKKGEIYTVNSVDSFGDVLLEEIKAPNTGHYYGDRFKPINPAKYDIADNIAIVKEIVEERIDVKITEPVEI